YFNLFFNHTTTIEIYTLSLHDALPICLLIRGNYTWSKALGAYSDDQTFARIDRNDHFFYAPQNFDRRHNLSVNWVYELPKPTRKDRKSTRLNSSHVKISYAVFCLKKKK